MFRRDFSGNGVLRDAAGQRRLAEEGFVVVPFYTPDEVEALTAFHRQITPGNGAGFQPTTYVQGAEYRQTASDFIRRTASPRLESLLTDFKAFMGSFIVKYPGKDSELGLHQDMTLVDESRFMGINIWSPLCDTGPENGALYLLPRSHRLAPTYRAATIPNLYDKHHKAIRRYLKPLYMKAGEAVLFDNSLLHYSPANRSGKPRIATNIFVTHKQATITICYREAGSGQVELFEQSDDFFTEYRQFGGAGHHDRPGIGSSIGLRDYDFPVLTPAMLRREYGKPPGTRTFLELLGKFGKRTGIL